MKIKFCGLRRLEDIKAFNKNKVDYIGFVFAESKRQVSKEEAETLIERLNRDGVSVVGVFANQTIEFILDIALDSKLKLDVIQLHGNENQDFIDTLKKSYNGEIWKAVKGNEEEIMRFDSWDVDKILIDSSKGGGSGYIADWSLIKEYRDVFNKDFILAGGLNVCNIIEGIKETNPDIVDISSGIEEDGFKKEELMFELKRKVKDYGK